MSKSSEHWDNVYRTKAVTSVSWYQPTAEPSLAALDEFKVPNTASLIDIGGGASPLVDNLIGRGWNDLTVLDIAAPALEIDRQRLGSAGERVHWIAADITNWMPDRAQEKAVQDREFSYVDLVVDAHRKRPGTGSSRGADVENLPANMIVIFNPGGAIIRFQSFSDIDDVAIQPGDLVGGKLHYKFLNYSVDRRNIYLNGIDQEMKVATPGG